jgi:hypothetical protein
MEGVAASHKQKRSRLAGATGPRMTEQQERPAKALGQTRSHDPSQQPRSQERRLLADRMMSAEKSEAKGCQ